MEHLKHRFPFCWDFPDNDTIDIPIIKSSDDPSTATVTQTQLQNALANIFITKESDRVYTLNVDGQAQGTITIPDASDVENITFDGNNLIFTINGEDKKVDISSLIDEYNAGDGIDIDKETKTISVKIDDDTDQYITVSSKGLKLYNLSKLTEFEVSDDGGLVIEDK